MASTEALIRMGIKIKQLHCCEIDPAARAVATARLKTLSGIFPDLLAESAFENCFGLLSQDVKLINQSHVLALGRVDLVVCGFPCQGFSRASGTAKGLRDPRTAVFVDVVRLVHRIIRHQGNCAWLFENVDASDHPDLLVRQEFNEVVKGVLGQGCAFDAVAVGSYAHRYRRIWTNLIPTTLLHEMVAKRFEAWSPTQTVQDVLGPGTAGPHGSAQQSPRPTFCQCRWRAATRLCDIRHLQRIARLRCRSAEPCAVRPWRPDRADRRRAGGGDGFRSWDNDQPGCARERG